MHFLEKRFQFNQDIRKPLKILQFVSIFVYEMRVKHSIPCQIEVRIPCDIQGFLACFFC